MERQGFHRRILIEPSPGKVTAELEDDYHRMVVTLEHSGGVVTSVASEMKRSPWTTCPGAMAQLAATFQGQVLTEFPKRGEKTRNCTHLHDLALFAAAHAEESGPVAYEVTVTDPVDGRREALLRRGDGRTLSWVLEGDLFLAPAELAGKRLQELGAWVAGLDRGDQEPVRILRWAAIIAYGRAMDIPAGSSATRFPGGACYTFQPDTAVTAKRREGADRDFSPAAEQPMADRASVFEDLKSAI